MKFFNIKHVILSYNKNKTEIQIKTKGSTVLISRDQCEYPNHIKTSTFKSSMKALHSGQH